MRKSGNGMFNYLYIRFFLLPETSNFMLVEILLVVFTVSHDYGCQFSRITILHRRTFQRASRVLECGNSRSCKTVFIDQQLGYAYTAHQICASNFSH
jgi:hypothetical protein